MLGTYHRLRKRHPQLIRVTDSVYSAINYSAANIIYVLTGSSVVVVDTSQSTITARLSLEDFRRVSSLPVSHIILTHWHVDHTLGAKAFYSAGTKIIGHKRLAEEMMKHNLLLPYFNQVRRLQFNFHRGVTAPGTATPFDSNGYMEPNVLVDEQYIFDEGGVRFELYHMEGETVDHLVIWLPQEKVLLSADLFYSAFPMLASPMKPDRPVLKWAQSLEKMRHFHAEYMVPGHGTPIRGANEVDLVLANYSAAIKHVHDETVKYINTGCSLEDIRRQVRLPEKLASVPYLAEVYGTVEWAVNGIVKQYIGWYGLELNPSRLNPAPSAQVSRAILQACGGASPLIERSWTALNQGEDQLVLELTDVVLGALPNHAAATSLRAEALRRLARSSPNYNERNIYLAAERNARDI